MKFEITSAWRRKHHWPCKKDEGFNGPDGYPGLGQELSIVGLAMVSDDTEKRFEAAGQVSSKFYPGDLNTHTHTHTHTHNVL